MFEITGDKALDRMLNDLGAKQAKKIAVSSLRKGMIIISKGIKREVNATFKQRTGNLQKGIGYRLKKISNPDKAAAIIGVGVGSAKALEKNLKGSARHLHLLALGTKNRFIKTTYRQKSGRIIRAGHPTGHVESNHFVGRGFAKVDQEASQKIMDSIRIGIEKAGTQK